MEDAELRNRRMKIYDTLREEQRRQGLTDYKLVLSGLFSRNYSVVDAMKLGKDLKLGTLIRYADALGCEVVIEKKNKCNK